MPKIVGTFVMFGTWSMDEGGHAGVIGTVDRAGQGHFC